MDVEKSSAVDDADNPETQKISKISEKLISESYFLAGVSAIGYLGTYFFSKSYLAYFGIDDVFVEISPKSLILFIIGFIGLGSIIWSFVQMIPISVARCHIPEGSRAVS